MCFYRHFHADKKGLCSLSVFSKLEKEINFSFFGTLEKKKKKEYYLWSNPVRLFMITILNFSSTLWLTWGRFLIFLQNKEKWQNCLIIQFWIFLQSLISASTSLLNSIRPSVCKDDTLWEHYSQFLLPVMFAQPYTSAVVMWKDRTFSFHVVQ